VGDKVAFLSLPCQELKVVFKQYLVLAHGDNRFTIKIFALQYNTSKTREPDSRRIQHTAKIRASDSRRIQKYGEYTSVGFALNTEYDKNTRAGFSPVTEYGENTSVGLAPNTEYGGKYERRIRA